MDTRRVWLIQQVQAVAMGQFAEPLRVELHPTDECNHACIWCVALPERRKGAQLPGERLLRLIDELADCGTMELTLSGGGDPLMHPDIGTAIERASVRGMAVDIITNGGNLTAELEAIVQSHASGIRFSLDAGTAGAHQSIHRPPDGAVDTFDNILCRIQSLVNERQGGRPRVGTSFVLHRQSIATLRVFLEVSFSLGVDVADIKYNFFAKENEANQLLSAADDVVESFRQEHPGFSVTYDRVIHRHNLPATVPVDVGDWPYLHVSAVIDATGRIYPCCHLIGNPDFWEGDVGADDFRSVWFSENRKKRLAAIEQSGQGCRVCVPKTPNQTFKRAMKVLHERKGGVR